MAIEVTPSEVRIEHSVADQRSVTRAFTVLYVLIAAGALVAALVEPELLLGAVFFAGVIAWWSWRVRRAASDVPWRVVLTPDELRHLATGVDVRVPRAEAADVRVEARMGPRMQIQVLKVRDADRQDLLTVSLPGRNEAVQLEAALEEWGWPVRS